MKYFYLLTAIALSVSFSATAEEKKEKEELAKTGTLSSSIDAGFSDRKVKEPWGGDAIGAQAAPITGSVSKLNNREWVMRLYNKSESKFSVSVEVAQYSDRNKKIKGDHFSYTLKPGATVERTVRTTNGTKSAALHLRHWKNLTPPKEEKPEEAAETAKEPAAPAKPKSGIVPGVPTKQTRSF